MKEDKQYDPDVYKRLELVTKQFQSAASEQRKLRNEERRAQFVNTLRQNKIKIIRLATYVILSLLVIAVIMISIIK